MNEGSSLDCNITRIIAAWKKRPASMITAMEQGLQAGLRQFERQRMIKEQLSGRKSDSYGLNVGTGNARNALNVKMYRMGTDSVGVITVGGRAWYLKVHQHYNFDGYIKPRNATLLAIPVHPAAKGRRPADFNGQLVFVKRAGRPPLLVRVLDKGTRTSKASMQIMFALKPRVYIPKRLYFFEEFQTLGREMIKRNILERLREKNDEE